MPPAWHYVSIPMPLATNTSLGVVQGDLSQPNKVSIELDGTMTVNGFNDLAQKQQDEYYELLAEIKELQAKDLEHDSAIGTLNIAVGTLHLQVSDIISDLSTLHIEQEAQWAQITENTLSISSLMTYAATLSYSLATEIDRAKAAEATLQANIDAEAAIRDNEDNALNYWLTDLQSYAGVLSDRIQEEATTRASEDQRLTEYIEQHAQALQDNLDTETQRATAREDEIETNARKIDVSDNGDGSFKFTNYDGFTKNIPTGKSISSDDGTVSITETAVNYDLSITPEINRAKFAENTLSYSIVTEAQKREDADATLQANIDTVEYTLSYSIATERSLRENADNALSDRIDNLNDYKTTLSALAPIQEIGVTYSAVSVDLPYDRVSLQDGTVTPSGLIVLPVADADKAGVMPATAYQAVEDHEDRIKTLELGGAGTISANLGATPAQNDLTNAWQTAKGNAPVEGNSVINLDTPGIRWTWLYNVATSGEEWVQTGMTALEIATETKLGGVKSSSVAGQSFVESDGTMSLNGFSALQATDANLQGQLTTLDGNVVKLSGDQTVSGLKQFNTHPQRSAAAPQYPSVGTEYATKSYVDFMAGLPSDDAPINGSLWEKVPVTRLNTNLVQGGSIDLWLNRFVGLYFVNVIGLIATAGASDDLPIGQIPDNYPLLTSTTYLHFGGSPGGQFGMSGLMAANRQFKYDKLSGSQTYLYKSALFPAGL